MAGASLPPGWAHVAGLPLSQLAPRRVLADRWEEVGDPAGPALRQLCDVLECKAGPDAVDAWPSALDRAAPALFPERRPGSALRQTARALARPFHPADRLTPEQELLVPVWREAWRRVVSATGPTDEEAARPAVDAAYAAAELPAPAETVWFDNPRSAEAAVPPGGEPLAERLWDLVVRQEYERVRAGVGERLWGEVWHQVTMGFRVRAPSWRRGAHIPEEAAPGGRTRLQFTLFWLLNWLPMFSFWYAVGGVRGLDRLAGLWQLAELAGECWPFPDVAILIRRPAEIEMRGRRGVRIVYADGQCEET